MDNHWSSTKFCATQFEGAHEHATRADQKELREAIVRSKCYADLEKYAAPWTGDVEFAEIVKAIEARNGQRAPPHASGSGAAVESDSATETPESSSA